MFKRMLQASSGLGWTSATPEETNTGLSTPIISEPPRTDPVPKAGNAKLAAFDEIYSKSSFKSTIGPTEYNILKVAEMATSEQLHGLSATAKHCALMILPRVSAGMSSRSCCRRQMEVRPNWWPTASARALQKMAGNQSYQSAWVLPSTP